MHVYCNLASQNDFFKGKHFTIYSKHKFLKLIEKIASFENPMDKHLKRIKNQEIYQHYLGTRILTELLHLIGNKIWIKNAKYCTTMHDTTPDISYKKQSTLVIRIVFTYKQN